MSINTSQGDGTGMRTKIPPFPPDLKTDGPDFLSSTEEDALPPLTEDLRTGREETGSDKMIDGLGGCG